MSIDIEIAIWVFTLRLPIVRWMRTLVPSGLLGSHGISQLCKMLYGKLIDVVRLLPEDLAAEIHK